MPDSKGSSLSKDMQESVLIAMMSNPEHATNVAKLTDEELTKIDSAVPPDDKQ